MLGSSRGIDRNGVRYRCEPCGFSSGVVVNGRQRLPELDLGDRASLSLVRCPRCGRRNPSNVFRLGGSVAALSVGLAAVGATIVFEEAVHLRALGALALVAAMGLCVGFLRWFSGARRAVRFLPY